MNASTLQRVVRVILQAAELPADTPVTADTELIHAGLGLSSATILDVLLALELEFNLQLDALKLLEARALRTSGTLAEFIELQQRGAGG